jgi:hypothetical protein
LKTEGKFPAVAIFCEQEKSANLFYKKHDKKVSTRKNAQRFKLRDLTDKFHYLLTNYCKKSSPQTRHKSDSQKNKI